MTTNPIIEVKNLQKSFGELEVLKGINTEVQRGEVVVVIGPSGSGKSTFLRCLNLMETPTGGSIFVDGAEITDPKCDINLHRQKMGMVFQHFNLFNNMTILRNMTLAPMKLLKKSRAEAEEKALALLRQYDRLSYSALPSYTPQPGDLLLTGPNHGTCFYLTADAPPTLVRVNHDGYSAAAKQSADGASLGADPAYAQWRQDLAAYLSP